jgi:hypothetical protein
VLPGELAKHAVSEGTKAVTSYNARLSEVGRPTSSAKAGLTFGVDEARDELLLPRLEGRVDDECTDVPSSLTMATFLTAVAEYLAAEILELAGNQAKTGSRRRVWTRHVKEAIRDDEELSALYPPKEDASDDDDEDDDDEEDDEEDDEGLTFVERFDAVVEHVQQPGAFGAGGRAAELPQPMLGVRGVEDVLAWPLPGVQARQVIEVAKSADGGDACRRVAPPPPRPARALAPSAPPPPQRPTNSRLSFPPAACHRRCSRGATRRHGTTRCGVSPPPRSARSA